MRWWCSKAQKGVPGIYSLVAEQVKLCILPLIPFAPFPPHPLPLSIPLSISLYVASTTTTPSILHPNSIPLLVEGHLVPLHLPLSLSRGFIPSPCLSPYLPLPFHITPFSCLCPPVKGHMVSHNSLSPLSRGSLTGVGEVWPVTLCGHVDIQATTAPGFSPPPLLLLSWSVHPRLPCMICTRVIPPPEMSIFLLLVSRTLSLHHPWSWLLYPLVVQVKYCSLLCLLSHPPLASLSRLCLCFTSPPSPP